MAIRRTAEDKIIDIAVYVVVTLVFIMTVYPFYYCLVLSFNQGVDATRGGIYLWPRKPTLENYIVVFSNQQLLIAFGVTIARTVAGTMASLVCTGLFAYSMANKQLLFKKLYMGLLIFSMYFSGGLIPYFLLLRSLSLINTFWVYIVPALLAPFNVILMATFFRELPDSIEESARIDGANDLLIFFRIIIPLSTPIIATIALYSAVGHWNAWFDAAYFTSDKNLKTVSFWLIDLLNKVNHNEQAPALSGDNRASLYANFSYTAQTLRVAMMIVIVAPIICVYPFLQKYFVKGIMLGSVKG